MASDSGKVSSGNYGKARAIVDVTSQSSTTSTVRVRYILYNESPSGRSYNNYGVGWSISGTGSLDATGTFTFDLSPGQSATIITKSFTYTHRSDGTAAKLTFAVNPGDTGTFVFGNPPSITVDITPKRIPEAPGKPTGLSASSVASRSVKLSWSAPSDNGGASITNYRVRRWTGSSASGSFVNTDTGTTRSLTVSGLAEGGTYTFAVFAQNSKGWSAQSSTIRVNLLGRPSAPGTPTLSNATSTSLSASWAASSDNGGTSITNYALRRYSGSTASGTFVSDNANSRSRTVTGLTPGATYTFTTLAYNSVGWGAESGARTITLSKRPGPPTGVVASNVQATMLTVSWTAPGNTGGLPITSYLVRRWAGSSASGSYNDISVAASARSVAVSGLSSGQEYTFAVYARTAATDNNGYSTASSSVTVRTLAGVWVRISGTWRRAVPYVRRNGVWVPAIPYVRTAGVWKITT